MSDMYNTEIPALLVAAIKNADAAEARRMFEDADFCGRKLLEGLISTGRLLSGMGDSVDPQMWELRSLGDSIAVTAELVAGFSEVVEAYNHRIWSGEISGERQDD
ncbi:hypothetical protein HV299_00610 [Klebsiella grimontii]|uniref:hypothetical protein n=1 Tax=Klebsiella grimontii TaxID=2058152 RepID=UPI0015EAF69B|nr:hypothetical protein [Klebsiella grimontii]QLT06975.1 hypothetical protein HV299_00610 [Klebsiella grimontii]